MTQDGSFHGTEDGVCGYLSDGVLLLDGPRSQYVKPCVLMVLEVILVVLEVVLVVLEVTGPQVTWVTYETRLSLRPDLYSTAPPISTFPSATNEGPEP